MLKETLRLSDFNYCLPTELIAQYPARRRDDSRLLVLERAQGKIFHRNFTDIVDYFSPGDCLVLNNTKVIWARLIGRREIVCPTSGGGKQEVFLLENLSKNIYQVLAKPARKLTAGTKVLFDNGSIWALVRQDDGRFKIVEFCGNENIDNFWRKFGQVPLPAYIKRKPEQLDRKRYQTVYAQKEGATAAPTAGLHFTKGLLENIRKKGIHIVYLTLHVNYGTFAPVQCEDIPRHKIHREYFILPKETAEVINATSCRANKVFAVGTTAVRTLEECAQKSRQKTQTVRARCGWTELFIYPPYKFKAVDCLLTNFHLPKSTLLMLVSAFAGKELLFKAYKEAIKKGYRFFSYGDAMLII